MPTSGNMLSMPNVRASSGMIGTTWRPICLSRRRSRSRPAKAIVVDTSRLPEPALGLSKTLAAGWGSCRLPTSRLGSEPASARRRCIMYSNSGESSAGR